MSAGRTLHDLLAVLEEERAALLAGAYDQLDRFARIKARCMSDLDALPQSHPALNHLHAALSRNAALLEAAITGMQEARAAILGRREPLALSVYGPAGERQAMHSPLAGLERKV